MEIKKSNDGFLMNVQPKGGAIRAYRYVPARSDLDSTSSNEEHSTDQQSAFSNSDHTGGDSGVQSGASSPARSAKEPIEGADLSTSSFIPSNLIVGSKEYPETGSMTSLEKLNDELELSAEASDDVFPEDTSTSRIEEPKSDCLAEKPAGSTKISHGAGRRPFPAGKRVSFSPQKQKNDAAPSVFPFDSKSSEETAVTKTQEEQPSTTVITGVEAKARPSFRIQLPNNNVGLLVPDQIPCYQMDFSNYGAPMTAALPTCLLPNLGHVESMFPFTDPVEDFARNIESLLLKPESMEPNTDFEAVCVFVEAVNSIWLQLIRPGRLNDFNENKHGLWEHINKSIEGEAPLSKLTVEEVGSLVLAKVGADVVRGQVLRIRYGQPKMVALIFILDHGSCVEVPEDRIYSCTSDVLRRLPPLATRCKFRGVNYGFTSNNPEVNLVDTLTKILVPTDGLVGRIEHKTADCCEVDLQLPRTKGGNIHGRASSFVETMGKNIKEATMVGRNGIHLIPPGVRQILITDFISADQFYCWPENPTKSAEKLDTLKNEMKTRSGNFDRQITIPEVGNLVVVKTLNASRFYRCKVTHVNQDYTVRLASLDFGPNALKENVPMSWLRPMLQEEALQYPLALKCIVDGLAKSGLFSHEKADIARKLLMPDDKRCIQVKILNFYKTGEKLPDFTIADEDVASVEIILERKNQHGKVDKVDYVKELGWTKTGFGDRFTKAN